MDRGDRVVFDRPDLFRMPRVQLVATVPVGDDGFLACVTPFVHDVDESTTMGDLKDSVFLRAAEDYDNVDPTAILLMVGPGYCVFGADKYLNALRANTCTRAAPEMGATDASIFQVALADMRCHCKNLEEEKEELSRCHQNALRAKQDVQQRPQQRRLVQALYLLG
jgi:hypothetical protein